MGRPSASVLFTSIVLPLSAVTMSPGLTERPLGMFSVDGTTARIRAGTPSSAAAGALGRLGLEAVEPVEREHRALHDRARYPVRRRGPRQRLRPQLARPP